MLRIPVVKGDINKALKKFKQKFKSTGVIKKLREKKQFIKKSTKNKLIKQKAINRQKYLNNLEE